MDSPNNAIEDHDMELAYNKGKADGIREGMERAAKILKRRWKNGRAQEVVDDCAQAIREAKKKL